MPHHSLRRGLDLPIVGAASGDVATVQNPDTVGVDPREFVGLVPRLAAREGDAVQAGQPLFFHKFDPRVQVVSPAAGVVREVRRGARRVITDIVVETGDGGSVEHRSWDLVSLASISRDDALAQALAGGVWPMLRTRPLDQIADADVVPQAVLIGGMETGPLQPGADVLLSAGDRDAIQAAIHVFKALAEGGPVHLTHAEGSAHAAFQGLTGVDVHTFSGPHPAGHPPLQVNHVCPPANGGTVWWITAWDAAVFGRLFLSGRYDGTRIYAGVGAGVAEPGYVRTLAGAPVATIVGGTAQGDLRWIKGSVLSGQRTTAQGWAGFFPRAVHVLHDDVPREILGWALPKLGRWSAHAAYLKGLLGSSEPSDLRPGLYGGHRAIVPTGILANMIATPDIHPTFLFKSIIAGDLEGSVKLGLLDITSEEAALCAYICPSKTDYDVILREGLELYAKEA